MIHLPNAFETSRLRLRKPAIADAQEIFESYTQDLAVCRFMVWTPHASEAVTDQFIESCLEAWDHNVRRAYILTRRDSPTAIGMLEARVLGTTLDIGYVLAPQHWGKGLMPEAIQSLAGVALSSLGFFRVQATCDIENIPSQRALEKSGFGREGRLDRYMILPNISPEPRPCFMYAKCR